MNARRRRGLHASLLILGCLGLVPVTLAAAAAPASAASHAGPTAVVELGDSYMAGEGGRWLGNSIDPLGNHDGTDRACAPGASLVCTGFDKGSVYVDGSDLNGCHRADVAQITAIRQPGIDERLNLACSGAVTSNILRAADGGESQDGLPPQSEQLLAAAKTHDVKAVQLMIGGNDLGFANIILACFGAYETHTTPCSQTQSAGLDDAHLTAAQAKIEAAIAAVRSAMREAGYADEDYRLSLNTYPLVLPHAADVRYTEDDAVDRTLQGCPFYDVDADWANDYAGTRINAAVKAAAAAAGVSVLDLQPAFVGHQLCAKTDGAVTSSSPPSPTTSEWGRALSLGAIVQGDVAEVFHPNAYGHMAMGACLNAFLAAPVASYRCASAPGQTPAQESLTRTEASPSSPSAAATGSIGAGAAGVAAVQAAITQVARMSSGAFAASVAVDRTLRSTALRRGVRLRLRCSAACRATTKLYLGRATAKRLRLSTRVVGQTSQVLPGSGRGAKHVQLTKKAASRGRSVLATSLTLVTTVTYAGGSRTFRKTVPLTR